MATGDFPAYAAVLALLASIRFRREGRAAILPNGSAGIGGPPQVLQPDQYVAHAFELTVEVELVTAQPLKLGRI